MPGAEEATVFMIVDRNTREAYRRGEGARESGPLFFSSRERLEEYARQEDLKDYEPYEVPSGVLGRMKGKPCWLDGKRMA